MLPEGTITNLRPQILAGRFLSTPKLYHDLQATLNLIRPASAALYYAAAEEALL